MIGGLLAVALAACPAKAPAWGVHDEAALPRHAQIAQLVSDSRCRTYVLTRTPHAVLRLDASGELTPEFASAGALSLDVDAEQLVLDEAHDRLLTVSSVNGPESTEVLVHAWNLDGVPKRAFGKAGVARFEGKRLTPTASSTSGAARAVVFDDGALLVVLQVASQLKDESAVYATRLTAEGAVEFPVITPSFVAGQMAGVTPQLERVGAGGAWFFTSSGSQGFLARFDALARLDEDVGQQGVAKCPSIAYATALRADGDGVILGGTAGGYRQILERRSGTGALDPAFGIGGQIVFKADSHRLEHVRAFLRTGAGILSVFASYDPASHASRTGIVAWGMDGRLDPAYGANGVRWIQKDGAVTEGTAVTVDPLGRILVAIDSGASLIDSKMRSAVIRVEVPAPRPSPSVGRPPRASPRPTARPDEDIWEYTDEHGVTTYVNSKDAVPEAFRKKARRSQ